MDEFTVDVSGVAEQLQAEGVPAVCTHTGGGNWVYGFGALLGFDDEQGVDAYTVNVGPVYRGEDGRMVGYVGDLYVVAAGVSETVVDSGESVASMIRRGL